jgi:hypothetical protein
MTTILGVPDSRPDEQPLATRGDRVWGEPRPSWIRRPWVQYTAPDAAVPDVRRAA